MPGSPPLYIQTFHFGGPNFQTIDQLYDVVQTLMKDLGFTDIVRQPTVVSARTSNSHVAITFVGADPQTTIAVVVAAGDDAHAMRDKLVKGMKDLHFL